MDSEVDGQVRFVFSMTGRAGLAQALIRPESPQQLLLELYWSVKLTVRL